MSRPPFQHFSHLEPAADGTFFFPPTPPIFCEQTNSAVSRNTCTPSPSSLFLSYSLSVVSVPVLDNCSLFVRTGLIVRSDPRPLSEMVLDFPMIPGIDQSVALACKEFAHCDSTSADGSSTYTGSSGWSDAVTSLPVVVVSYWSCIMLCKCAHRCAT